MPSGPSGRGGAPSNSGGRGGGTGGRGGRGGSLSGGRGGLSGRGRGGSFSAGGSGRGGASGGSGQQTAPGRHGSRNFADKNFHNRRGGSFSSGTSGSGYSHSNSSFRGRNQGHSGSGRGNRNEGNALGSRDGTMSSNFGGKRDENRRTLTDFKIIGLEIPELGWTWGTIPTSRQINKEQPSGDLGVKTSEEGKEGNAEEGKTDSVVGEGSQAVSKTESASAAQPGEVEMTDAQASQVLDPSPHPPPSRIRIYFHTPVTPDDSRPIPHNASYGEAPMDTRKGKRKKLEDDDGDMEEVRAPPPPPPMAGINEDRVSVAGDVAQSVETPSEADWLMAAIVEGEDESKATTDIHPGEESEDADQLQISEIVNVDEHTGLDGDDDDARNVDEALFDGKQSYTVEDGILSVWKFLWPSMGRGISTSRTPLTPFSFKEPLPLMIKI